MRVIIKSKTRNEQASQSALRSIENTPFTNEGIFRGKMLLQKNRKNHRDWVVTELKGPGGSSDLADSANSTIV